MIDFSPVWRGETKLAEFAPQFQVHDMIAAVNAQIDAYVALIRDLTDAQVTSLASDPEAEGGVGWNVAHVVAHLTATSEEGAAVSSILARGIAYPFEPRLRTEVDWTTLTTTAACLQRLEESRRIQLGYLQTWPDQPRLDTYNDAPERLIAWTGPLNAGTSGLLGLLHADGHRVQLQEIIAQAQNSSL
jgi:hypothetical protein